MSGLNHWAKSGWAYKPSSVADLMSAVTRLGTHKSTRRFLWRGQANMHWSLEPALARRLRESDAPHDEPAVAAAEQKLLKAARSWPASEFAGPQSDQQLLAILQHHGVPTGLIDLTTDPLTALWFACEKDSDPDSARKAGVALVFDVTDWPNLATESASSYAKWSDAADPLTEEYRQHLAGGRPFLIEPTRPSGRMAAQRGRLFRAPVVNQPPPFLVQVDQVTGCGPKTPPKDVLEWAKTAGQPAHLPFAAIIIGTQQKTTLRAHLAGSFGLDRSRLFPEVAGFAEAVRNGSVQY
ncbi:MAG: FRG domain-containing protein [Candidatus Nanopelagicales bacterium]|nr:FRG domain-containing protein [Candidatus Nanopelagicales bacterium]